MAGARPGRRLQIDLPAISSLETTIRRSVRRLVPRRRRVCLDRRHRLRRVDQRRRPDWLGTTLGIAAAALSGLLIADFIWPRGGRR